MSIKNISILGLGWLGEPLGISLYKQGYNVSGSTTKSSKLKLLSKHPFYVGKIMLEANQIEGDWSSFIDESECLIINIPPKRITDIEHIYPAQIQQIVERTPKKIKVIFVSSTAVYGMEDKPFTEDVVTTPDKTSGVAVLAAEKILKQHFGENLTILRLAGLIGEDRHSGKFLAGKRVLKNAIAPVNLIHQSDCIRLIETIIRKKCFGEIINGCASEHPIRKDYYQKASETLALEQPIFETSEEVTALKIIDNTKSKTLLDFTYQYDNPEQIFTEHKKGEISIIGAGPGNVKLLTLQAFELLQVADVILYDNLVSEEILDVNVVAERIYVGRKYGDQSDQQERQDKINQLLEYYYQKGKKVVRLKSGDPYIYGRAAEEAHYLKQLGVPFTVVSGISAALAAANTYNIPITERQKSNAVLICTAHTADYSYDQLKGIAELLKAGNTLALYMGLKSLDKLIPKLIEVCGDTTIPINAVSNVSRSNQQLLTSTLGNIESDIKASTLKMPVVFLIGIKPIKAI